MDNQLKERLAEIKKELPAGAIAEIMKEAKASKGTVTNVLNGTSENLKVMVAISKVYNSYVAAKKSLMEACI